jgi:hypothetical protein
MAINYADSFINGGIKGFLDKTGQNKQYNASSVVNRANEIQSNRNQNQIGYNYDELQKASASGNKYATDKVQFIDSQRNRYANAGDDMDLRSRLEADAQRLGYSLGNSINTQVGTGVSTNTANTGNVNYWEENQRRMAEDAKAKEEREAQAKADAEAQAEAEALARQNAYNQSLRGNVAMRDQALRGIDSAFKESAQGLDNDYFQRYLMNQQQQVANGLNAGIAGDMDTRLGMARQGDLANIYRDTQGRKLTEQARFANEAQRLQEALNLTDAEKLARTAQLRNMHEQQGFQNYLAERGLNMEDFFRTAQMDLSNRTFNHGVQRDWATILNEVLPMSFFNNGWRW